VVGIAKTIGSPAFRKLQALQNKKYENEIELVVYGSRCPKFLHLPD
jgi:hypothetical protein